MCPFVEKKEKSVVFSSTYKYYETGYTIFSTPSNPCIIPTPPFINNYYNVYSPPYFPNPSYYSVLESTKYTTYKGMVLLEFEYETNNSRVCNFPGITSVTQKKALHIVKPY